MTSIFSRMLTRTRRARFAALVAATIAGTLSATVVLAPPASAGPSTLYVAQDGTNTGDCAVSPCATVSYALNQAASGATINVSGTIKDNVVVSTGRDVTITGVNAPAGASAVLDGSNAGTVVRVNSGVSVTLDHLTIQHGANSDSLGGGGVQVLDNGIVTLSHDVITGNTSNADGGGIESLGAVIVTDSIISANSAGGFGGGGIGAQSGSITVTRSTISGNSTTGSGGGIEMGNGTGGGSVSISDSTVSENAANGKGGGVWADGRSAVAITTSTIAGNRSGAGGGIGTTAATLTATTVANNSAHFGGGIYVFATSLSIAAGIVANNGTACDAVGNSTVVSTFSLIDDSTCGDPGSGDISGDSGLADLADNGGPTRTMALSHTGPAANAIPHGTSGNGVSLCPRTDQNGTAAPVDNLAGCSMGAVEATGPVLPLNTLHVAEKGSNSSNDCLAPASPCATVSYALTQLPGSAMSSTLPVTIEVAGTVMDNVTVTTQRPITISGAAAPADSPAVLDGNAAGPVLVANTGADLELDHLTLQHGVGKMSGGGGGLLLYNATARLRHVTVTANTSPLGGGGILNAGSGLVISDSTISGNTAGTCEGCVRIGGGGIATEPDTTTTVTNSTISGNTTRGTGTGGGEGEGGGIFNLGALTVNGSTISGNTAGYKGGGVASTGSATISDSTIVDNSATLWGGGLDGRGLTITHTTIDGNAAEKGTQIANQAGTITLAASIVGTGTGTGSCTAVGSPTTFASVGYNLDQDGSCALTGGTGDVTGASPQLRPLADNGGPTATSLPEAGSPAAFSVPVDTTGDGIALCPHADQRGVSGPVSGQTKCTRGAVEAAAVGTPTFTSVASHTVSFGTRFRFPVTTDAGALTTLAVDAESSLPAAVTFSDNGAGSGEIAGYVLHPGTYSFTLSASNGAGRTTTQAFTLEVTKRGQVPLTLTSLSGVYVTALPLTNDGGSGTGAVTYTAASGTASGCTVDGSTLTASSIGTCTVTATKAGDDNYLPVSSDATIVTFAEAAQVTLTITSTTGTLGTPLALTTDGGSGSGTVTYTAVNGTASGCTVSGSTLSATSVGSCTVTATKAGDDNYRPVSSDPTTVTFAQAAQATLTISSTTGTYGIGLALTTSGGSGSGTVTYTAVNGTASGCTVSGSTLSATSAGTCTVTANKAGDADHLPVSSAPTSVTFIAPVPSPPLGAGLSQATFASGFNGVQDVASDAVGNIFVADMYNGRIVEYSPDGSLMRTIAVTKPTAVAVDSAGIVYVAQWHAAQILKIATDGMQTHIGTGFGDPEGIAVDDNGNVYVTDDSFNNLSKIKPNGEQVGLEAHFSSGPKGVTTDAAGNVYVVDPGAQHVVQIRPDDTTTQYGPTFPSPRDVAIDGAGNLYVSDVNAGGTLYFAAPDDESPAVLATDIGGGDVFAALDPDGAVYVSASGPNVVYRYTRAPQASTVDATSVMVTWAPPAFPRGTAEYTVTAKDATTPANGGQTCTYTVTAPETDACTVTGLSAGDSYTFTVTATNSVGTGAPSAPTNPVTMLMGRFAQTPLTVSSVEGTVGIGLDLQTSGGSGTGAVSFTTVGGTASGCTMSGSSLSVTTAGTCTVTATKAGDDHYLAVSSDPTTVTFATTGGTGGGSGGTSGGGDVPPTTTPAPPATPPVTTTVTAGGTASSSPDAHPTADNPVIASVQSPVPGTITFTPVDAADPYTGYTMLGHGFVITAPAATADKPLRLSFAVDTSALPSGVKLSDLTVFRDGVPVPECAGARGTASPDPCVTSVTTASGAASVQVLSSHASTWTFGVATPGQDRIGGANRYETAASIATAFGAATAVVVANGETFKQGFDALSASFLAGRAHAPILLTAATSLPSATASAVKHVLSGSTHPTVYVMGGKDSISDAVAAALKTAAGGSTATIVRVAGANRYDTSVAAATAMTGSNIGSIRLSAGGPLSKTAILASGVVNADALAAGALSAAWGIPMLLTGGDALPATVAAAIKDRKITQLIVLGGTDRVSAEAVDQAKTAGAVSVKRIAGSDRYATAAKLYAFAFDTAVDADGEHYGAGSGHGTTAYLANGVTGFPDALSVGPLAGRSEGALLTTGPDRLATATALFLTAHAGTPTTVIALGKTPTLAVAVLAAAQKAIR